jgi:hypothetical protein
MSRDPRRTGLSAAAPWTQIDGGEYAMRLGRGICKYLNNATPGVNWQVQTAASILHNIAPGTVVFVGQYCYGVETVSDSGDFEFGYTDQPDGAGTFTALGPDKHVYTGGAQAGRTSVDQDIRPAGAIRYSDGARCVTFRMKGNDAGAQLTVGWHGWWEPE